MRSGAAMSAGIDLLVASSNEQWSSSETLEVDLLVAMSSGVAIYVVICRGACSLLFSPFESQSQALPSTSCGTGDQWL